MQFAEERCLGAVLVLSVGQGGGLGALSVATEREGRVCDETMRPRVTKR